MDPTPATERGSASGAPPQDGELGQDAALLQLRAEKEQLLFDSAMAAATELADSMRFEDARLQVTRALEYKPTSLEAKQLLGRIQTALGIDAGAINSAELDGAAAVTLRWEQAKLDAKSSVTDGKLAQARGDYDRAIAEYSIAKIKIEMTPYNIAWDGLDEEVDRLLAQAKEERRASEESARLSERETATREKRALEAESRGRERAVVDNIVSQATLAFEAGRYDAAKKLADKALALNARHEQAQDIRDAAHRAGREKVRADYIEAKREEYRVWRESLEQMRIPNTDVLTLPNAETWQEKSALRSQRRGLDLSKKVSPAESKLREQLRTTTVRLPGIEREESLDTLIGMIRNNTGLPLIVDPAAEASVVDNGVVFQFNFENELTVEQALNRLTAMAGEDVTWTLRYDAIFVTTKEKAAGTPTVLLHDVQDLIFAITDFTGPRIDRLRLLNELEDEDGGGPWGSVGESQRMIQIDDLATLVRDTVAPSTWEGDGVSIEAGEGFLVVTQTAEVQQQVKDFLEDLRRFNSALVTIDAKFMEVGESWIQEIGTDFRGLDDRILEDVTNGLEDMASLGLDNGGSGIDGTNAAGQPSAGFYFDDGQDGSFAGTAQNFFTTALGQRLSNIGGLSFQMNFFNDAELSLILRAVEKSDQFQIVNSQTLSVHNTQRAYVTVINQKAYIQDFDVEVAQLQSVADPQINVLHEGVVLDVRPTIGHDRKWLQLEVQPTVARVVSLRNFSTTLGGNTSPVEFQLPELEVQSVNTSAYLPDGGSLLLGGLSRVRNVERRAEVPWIAKIPVLGFLFKQEGYNDERESLMILIKATITDIREEVSRELEGKF
ncbi:MAG: hypothetical protein R3F49_22805 [Planctomycetota bacterium]